MYIGIDECEPLAGDRQPLEYYIENEYVAKNLTEIEKSKKILVD